MLGFVNRKRRRGGNRRFGAVLVPKILCYCCFFIPCRQDAILTTQRKFDIKISMVGIDKVKVRLASLSLAHVSHFFFAHAPVCAPVVSTFFIFENFENFNVLTVSAQTGALAHFRRQILHFRAHRKCTDWSTCALSATNPAFSSSP